MERTKFGNEEKLHIVIPDYLFEQILKHENPADTLALYTLYYYKSLKRKTGRIKATTEYVQEKLNWSVTRVRKAKRILEGSKLIKEIVVRNGNRFMGNYIEINITPRQLELSPSDSSNGQPYFILYNNICQNELSPSDSLFGREKTKERNTIPPTLEQVATYCKVRKNNVDPQAFIDFYESKGWMIGKNKMKNWQAAVRTWEQKESEKPQPKRKSVIVDGIRYIQGSDGRFRSASGQLYIE